MDTEKTQFLNMRTSTAEEIITSLFGEENPSGDKRKIQLEEKGDWVPWFPVIDYDRCKNCMQCLNFCLFGVYELSKNDQVQVTNPAGCKTNCPACARLCPHEAIIFPKYPDSPINGDDVGDSQGDRKNIKLDSGAISGNDIYEILKKRSRTGQRFEKDRANLREMDLTKLKDQLRIPSEVIESLKLSEVTELQKKSEKKNRE
jgi:NAD-dependent dihydropyrimidine dehydrogenase PreA subunit